MADTLDKRYRPQSFEGVIGNVTTVKALKTALDRESGYVATTLLSGPSGCGKTTLARIIARELGARNLDLKELNISDMRGIDAARMIIDVVKVAPWGSCRVVILNECHKATKEFQNAMLELLEEPPPDNYFILCTTEPEKLLKSVKNRCTIFQINKVQARSLIPLIGKIAKMEKISITKDVIEAIAHNAGGSPRQALVMLDALVGIKDKKEQLDLIVGYHYNESNVWQLYQAVTYKKPWKEVADIIKGLNATSAEEVRFALLALLERDILAGNKNANRAVNMLDFFASSFQLTGRPGITQACWLALKA